MISDHTALLQVSQQEELIYSGRSQISGHLEWEGRVTDMPGCERLCVQGVEVAYSSTGCYMGVHVYHNSSKYNLTMGAFYYVQIKPL